MSKSFFHHLIDHEQSRIRVSQSLKARLAQQLQVSPTKPEKISYRFRFFAMPIMGAVGVIVLMLLVFSKPMTDGLDVVGLMGSDDRNYSPAKAKQSNMIGLSSSAALSNLSPGSSIGSRITAGLNAMTGSVKSPSVTSGQVPTSGANELGYSVGGAKDVGNFRKNIEKGYMPLLTDLTYEGLFYDYFFDTGIQQLCAELFCPSYARAVTRDPQTGAEEYYLSVGLNSNIKESDFHRPKTNFVVVLDISGSMDSAFDQYYYDGTGKRTSISTNEAVKTKMQLASEAVGALVDQLKPDDRLGIVLFSDSATVAKQLGLIGSTNRTALKQHLMELQGTNGTNMSAGLEEGARLLLHREDEERDYANRLIFITDAMPNAGEFGAGGLQRLVQQNEDKGIHMTLIGVGVDFQSELAEAITKVRGANYLSIHSAEEFKQKLGEQFDFLVTPLVYDLKLSLGGSGFAIDKVYGSPDTDLVSGDVMHVRTLFPSKTEEGQTRGGIVLLKLKKESEQSSLALRATYEDTKGKKYSNDLNVSFKDMRADTYENLGLRKGILLARYGELLKGWLAVERHGITTTERTAWERSSHPLSVSADDQLLFSRFAEYFRTESLPITDKNLDQEWRILEKLKTLPVAHEPLEARDDWME